MGANPCESAKLDECIGLLAAVYDQHQDDRR